MSANFFEIKQFSCGYPSFHLSDISFSLERGTFAGIIGPNGSGKTTLFRGITGTLSTLAGEVRLQGKNLKELSLQKRAQNIAIVTQTVDAGQITVEDYVLMGRMPYHSRFQFFETKRDYELAQKYMELTGVLKHKDKLMTELSGGEQQRAAIARALTQEPELLLLDEPTSHLDITHQVRILNLLQRLNDEMGLTVLMVVHDLNLASEYCDQLIMFREGKIFLQGKPENVLTFETIEEVYKTPVITRINPYSNKPVIFLVSEKMMKNR
ncbi:ABC transporter ATP-binding protein [Mangrovibacterium diazotrophicum]|uniref:Iron complex transport system ATP-binding protein n=1 Tax=Mangrovibacterium diazotrophicum TaxID=1261403 RepID=A0A419WA19_9BACT|nr:ABC transporter ATP-binding protein [Mangrovibacterium diazotrophicum]RKD92307.1 iron complex transport system ATP-binding protein [Mangrovibacterium diazotrophicum]